MTLLELIEKSKRGPLCHSCSNLLCTDELRDCEICGEPICDDCYDEYKGMCWYCRDKVTSEQGED